jgi:alpha-amylase
VRRSAARLLAALLAARGARVRRTSAQATLPAGALVYGPPVAPPPAERWASDPGDGVYYQVFVRSFQDSTGDGIGDLRGLTARLPYLAGLGSRACGSRPSTPRPATTATTSPTTGRPPRARHDGRLPRLRARRPRHGMRVVLDLVVNHSSDRHPWFVAARAGDGRYRGWYRFERDPEPLIGTLGGRAWHDAGDGTRYLGLFVADMPDLDHRNPEVSRRCSTSPPSGSTSGSTASASTPSST